MKSKIILVIMFLIANGLYSCSKKTNENHQTKVKNLKLVSNDKDTVLIVDSSDYEEISNFNYIPDKGCLYDKKAALLVAEVLLKSVYGNKAINEQKPLTAILIKDSIWYISGSFYIKKGIIRVGGVAEIRINKFNCKVLGLSHGR